MIDLQNKPASADETVLVSTDSLITGHRLEHPIYNERGVLLVKSGAVLTQGIKELLWRHKIESVKLHRADAEQASFSNKELDDLEPVRMDSELEEKLDAIVSSGMMVVKSEGPSVKDGLVFHGRKAYDQSQRESLSLQHAATSESLDSMMRGAIRGEEINSGQISQLTALFLSELADDSDCVLSTAMGANRPGFAEHAVKMAILAMSLGVEMGLDAANVRLIGLSGLVCDWGMAKIPPNILTQSRPLTMGEYLTVQKHPFYTLDLLERIGNMMSVVPLIAFQVHEKVNGTGYPRRRSGTQIHQMARILYVADVYTALTSARPQRPALMPYAAMECLLQQCKAKEADADVVRALLRTVGLFPIGSFIQLSDKSMGRVHRVNRESYTQPIVQLLRDAKGRPIPADPPEFVDLVEEEELKIVQPLPTPGRREIQLSPEIAIPRRK